MLVFGQQFFPSLLTSHTKYGILDQYAEADEYLARANLGFDDAVNVLVERKWSKKYNWIQEYDVSIERLYKSD